MPISDEEFESRGKTEVELPPNQKKVYEYLKSTGGKKTSKEIQQACELKHQAITNATLRALMKKGLVRREAASGSKAYLWSVVE